MRMVLIGLLVMALAAPAAAHPVAGFPARLTFNPDGTLTGTFGGVPVTGTYSGTTSSGTFALMVDGQVFATGTYACNGSGCTLSGTQLLGASKSFTIATAAISLSGATVSGNLSGLFATHGAWVSAVAKWAQANLTALRVGQVVRAAASIQSQGKKAAGGGAEVQQERGQGKAKGRDR